VGFGIELMSNSLLGLNGGRLVFKIHDGVLLVVSFSLEVLVVRFADLSFFYVHRYIIPPHSCNPGFL
jgi:hypothetical protein